MFDAAVLALRVLTDGDQVDVSIRSLVALDGDAGSHVGVKVEGLPEQQVHGGVTCSDGRLQGSWRRRQSARTAIDIKKVDPTNSEADLTEQNRTGPFSPILLLSIDSLASGGIIHLPPGPFIAVTFLSSHLIGACRSKQSINQSINQSSDLTSQLLTERV